MNIITRLCYVSMLKNEFKGRQEGGLSSVALAKEEGKREEGVLIMKR